MRALVLVAVFSGVACDRSHVGAASLPSSSPPRPSPSALVAARPYEMHVPPKHEAHAPLVVLLHGYGGDHGGIDRFLGTSALADEEGFFLALPDGTLDADGKRFWNATDACCDFRDVPVDDVAYVDALIDDALAAYPVDPKRVYLVGYSNGGFLSHRYACDHSDRVAAIVSFAGVAWKDASLCAPRVPVSVLQVHGDADDVVRYGGLETRDPHRLLSKPYPGARDTVAMWGHLDGCAAPTTTDEGRDELVRYGGCAGGSAVELWAMHGMPHALRLTSSDMHRAWSFLAQHAR